MQSIPRGASPTEEFWRVIEHITSGAGASA